jgi:hypothetical protein
MLPEVESVIFVGAATLYVGMLVLGRGFKSKDDDGELFVVAGVGIPAEASDGTFAAGWAREAGPALGACREGFVVPPIPFCKFWLARSLSAFRRIACRLSIA